MYVAPPYKILLSLGPDEESLCMLTCGPELFGEHANTDESEETFCLAVLGNGGLNIPLTIPTNIASGHFKPYRPLRMGPYAT